MQLGRLLREQFHCWDEVHALRNRFSQTVRIRRQSERFLLSSSLSHRSRYIFHPRPFFLICHTSVTLETQNGAIFFVWLLARVAGDFWAVHWQCFTQLKELYSPSNLRKSRLQNSIFMSPYVRNTLLKKEKIIVHLVSLYIYHHQWMYQLEWVSRFSKKLSVDKLICHESHTQVAP